MLGMLGCRSGIIFSKPLIESNYYSMCFFGCEKFRFFTWYLPLVVESKTTVRVVMAQREQGFWISFFKKNFGGHKSFSCGATWTSGDVSSGFQSQSGQPYLHLAEVYVIYVLRDSPLVWHLLTSWLPASHFPHMHVSAEVGYRPGLKCETSHSEVRRADHSATATRRDFGSSRLMGHGISHRLFSIPFWEFFCSGTHFCMLV